MKNKLYLVLFAIALFIPTIIALTYYTIVSSTPVEQREMSCVEIVGGDGHTFTLERGSDKDVDEMLDFFATMNKNAETIDYSPELDDKYKLEFVYHNYAEEHKLKYYFPMTLLQDSVKSAGGYYVNADGQVMKLAEGDVAKFLASTYSRSLYEGIAMPDLLLSGSGSVLPQEVKWTFREVGGSYVNYDTAYDVTKDIKVYEMASDFGMRFTVEPDIFTIKLTQGGSLLYEGDYANMVRSLELDEEKSVSVEVRAQWSEGLSHNYAGSISYRFDANLIPPPIFSISTAELSDATFVLEQGGMAVITGKNIKDTSDITLKTSPDLGYQPNWYTHPETGTVYALVPVPADFAGVDGEEVVFTVESGGTSSNLTVKFNNQRFETLSDLNEGHYQSEMMTILEALPAPTDGSNFISGAFVDPVKNAGNVPIRGYGRKADGQYIHNGADFRDLSATDSVYAGAGGTVVYANRFSTGESVVVIDHGLGLRSWYVNLTIDGGILPGTVIEAGTVLGTCKQGVNLHCSITVDKVAISPYKLWAFTAENTDYLLLK